MIEPRNAMATMSMRAELCATLVGLVLVCACKAGQGEVSRPDPGASTSLVTPPEHEGGPAGNGWTTAAKDEYREGRKLEASDTTARYSLESAGSSYELALDVASPGLAKWRLTDASSARTYEHEWTTEACSAEFYQGEGAIPAINELARKADGARLLELRLTCGSGEDIRSTQTLVVLLLVPVGPTGAEGADAEGLRPLWTGELASRSSWVCAEYDAVVLTVEPGAVTIQRSRSGEIYEPGETGYDCEDARNFTEDRGSERVPLP